MAEAAQVGDRIRSFSRGMTASQKLTIGVTLVLMVVGLVLLFRWATRPDYALLFSNLDFKEADQIVESLRAQNVPYKLSGGGTSVLIPSKDVYEWRMRLASQGLPSSGGIGYEIFDKKDIGISDFVQKVNYRRALEGELVRTIRGIGDIEYARVHIVIPEDRLFKEDQQEPTASIVLKVRSGARLTESQVQGIMNIVAASVEGLTPKNVTIVDSRGNILSNPWDSDSPMGLTANQHDLKRKIETYLENKAHSMLATVLGQGKAIVRVSSELNFQRVEQTNEKYDPDNAAVLSEERNEESNTDSAGEAGGSVEHTITNYQVPKTVEHITMPVGDITKLSVAVLVDGIRNRVVDENGEESWNYQPRSAEEMAMLSDVVKNAVGFDPLRNDQFVIQNIPFDTNQVFEEEPAPGFTFGKEWVMPVAQKALPVLLLLVFLFILRSKLKKVRLGLPPVAAVGKAESPSGFLENVPVPRIEESVTPEAVESAKLLKQISTFAEEKPQLAVRLLRYWLLEE